MKTVFSLLMMCSFGYSIGQNDSIKIGDIKFKTISILKNLTIYQIQCENKEEYQFASKSVIRYDSIKNIGYLSSYKYMQNFNCQEKISLRDTERIGVLISEKKRVNNQIGFLFGMEDLNNEFIGILYLFKKKRFKKFTRKANSLSNRTISKEVIMVREYNYSKYAKEFIIAVTGDKFSMIPVTSN